MMDPGKCSHGCVWPEGHDIWPLGGLVGDNQPPGPRKWAKIGQNWVYKGSEKFSMGWKVIFLTAICKGGIHARNHNFYFKNGRVRRGQVPLCYLQKSPSEASDMGSNPYEPLRWISGNVPTDVSDPRGMIYDHWEVWWVIISLWDPENGPK